MGLLVMLFFFLFICLPGRGNKRITREGPRSWSGVRAALRSQLALSPAGGSLLPRPRLWTPNGHRGRE